MTSVIVFVWKKSSSVIDFQFFNGFIGCPDDALGDIYAIELIGRTKFIATRLKVGPITR
jgi:hypothetical protein